MIAAHHHDLLDGAGIDLDVAETAGIYTVGTVDELPEPFGWTNTAPGLVFPWHPVVGEPVPQYRPDVAVELDGDKRKYLWPKDRPLVIDVHPAMRPGLLTAPTVLIVEGTKQHLAAVSKAPADVAVVGIVGCWGWTAGGVPLAELLDVTDNKDVVVIFDADVAGNRKVYDAATRLGEALDIGGAGKVRFARLPASGTAGLDDFLFTQPDPTASLERLIDRAGPLPKAPRAKAKGTHPFFDGGGLKVEALYDDLVAGEHLALDVSGRILHYSEGVYLPRPFALAGLVGDRLGDRYRSMHLRSVEEFTAARLAANNKVIAENQTLVNVSNGMLDPLTGQLHDHDPRYLSAMQFPVVYDPTAVCPLLDAWIDEVVGDRAGDLLEAAARILDRRPGRQSKALFLHGPTRSGKSTFVRLLEALVGPDARSAITLHDLVGDRFAAADAHGKALNAAADLSAAHVADLSTFKQMTGADPVRAQRKFGQPFTFTCTALFVFSTNTIPTVSEVSRAYLARVRPYRFGTSFEGREDPELETRLRAELPGIFNRLVEAFQRFETRGGYADDPAARDALDVFARHSDRVRLFVHEATDPDPDGFVARTALFEHFEEWARQNRREHLGRHRFFESIEVAGYRPAKRQGTRGFAGLTLRDSDDWGDDDDPGGTRGSYPGTSPHEGIGGGEGEEVLVRQRCDGTAPSAPSGEPVTTQVATADPDELGEDWF